MAFVEKSSGLPESYDVIVCGGGPSGWVAAVAAARLGCRTALIERFGFFGGTATAGLVVPISGFFKNGSRVVGGIPWEFEQEMERHGAAFAEMPKGHISVDTEYYKLIAQRMVLDSGVIVYTNSLVSEVLRDGKLITGIRAVGNEGPFEIRGKHFIDATGNGNICSMAGISTRTSQTPQPLSLCFELIGVDTSTPLLRDSIHHTGKEGTHSLNTEIHDYLDGLYSEQKAPQFGGPWFNTMLSGDRLAVNITRSNSTSLNARDYMTAEFQMREDMFRLLDILKNKYPEFKNCSISASAVNAGIREGRHLVGVHTLTGGEIMRAEHFEDSVARNAHPIDMHCADGSSQVLQELSEAGYIPYRSLISPEADNVIVCGRAISADDAAHASIRVQATAMAVGQAAGTAAALCSRCGYSVHQLPAHELQKTLTGQNAIL